MQEEKREGSVAFNLHSPGSDNRHIKMIQLGVARIHQKIAGCSNSKGLGQLNHCSPKILRRFEQTGGELHWIL